MVGESSDNQTMNGSGENEDLLRDEEELNLLNEIDPNEVMDIDSDAILNEEKVNLDNLKSGRAFIMEKAFEHAEKMLRTYTKGNASTYESIMSRVTEAYEQMMAEANIDREERIVAESEVRKVKTENEKLQEDNTVLKADATRRAEREVLEATSQSQRQLEMVRFMEENEINSVEQLEKVITKVNKLGELTINQFKQLQGEEQKQRRLRDESQQLQQSQRWMELKMEELQKKLNGVLKENEELKKMRTEKEEAMRMVQVNTMANSFVRTGEQRQERNQNKHEVQITENGCTHTKYRGDSSSRQERLSGRQDEHANSVRPMQRDREMDDIIERARGVDSDEAVSDRAEVTLNSGRYFTEWDTGKPKELSQMELMHMMFTQQNLPEPPKFTAEENSVNLERFRKSFSLKFGSFSEEHQITLLETKYLGGRALRIYRGLPEREKETVRDVMQSMANRLRISPEDESRRAKSRWENLRKKPEQTIEDFCLSIDEIAHMAFKRVNASELSSLKTNKVLNAIAENETLSCLIDNRLLGVPERDHYDTCRMLAIRYEQGIKERRERNKVHSGDKKTGLPQQNNSAAPSSNQSQQSMQNVQKNNMQSQNKSNYTNKQGSNTENPENPINQNWRQRTPNNSGENGNTTGFQKCAECSSIGCHEPSCSRAPGNARTFSRPVVTCYRCQEKGHIATYCPQASQNKDKEPQIKENTVSSVEESQVLAIPCKLAEKENECLDKPVIRVEKGRIGGADVELMLDSGACISVISVKTWEKIVEVNGVEWEKKLTKGKADLRQVVTANNQPLKLLYTVEVETSMLTRTRLIKYYVADIDRDNIILGMDQFNKLGVEVRIEEQPRAIKLCKDIRLVPSSAKVIQVSVEGVMLEGKDQCLITPMHECIATSVCEVGADGKAYVTVSNFGTKSILLRKGQQIAGGEVDDFEVLQEKVEGENWKETEATVCNLVQKDTDIERWNTLCEHLKKQESNCESEEEIWKVIQSFQHIFAVSDSELGRTNATTCEIELLQGAEPIRQRPRPIPLAIRPEIRAILQKMLAQDVIRVSKSPWSSPVVIVKKKDGSVRMCVDYRKVNKVVKNNAHPLPHIEATLQSLTGKKIFTTLDLLAGYWQIPLEEKSKEITAFAIGSELFEYNVLPFGLVTSPAVFQATMEAVVGDLLGKNAFVYVDDLLIASETMEKHIQDLKEILIRLEASGMKLRASKCHIAQREVEYLGHRITPEGVKTEETKVNKMKNFTRPENAEQMRSFLGLTGYYRKFMLNYAQVASELTPLTSVKVAWVWQAEQEKAFQELIQLICSAPVLMQPNIEKALDGSRPFMIYCDASKKGVGAVLAQEGDDGLQHPIAFSSKALSPAEKRYHITDLEALAMMSALRKFKTITYGTSVVVFTDHKPLISLLKGSPLSDRLMRWSIEIMQFDVKIVYIAGQANVVADALSRGGCPPIEVEESETAELPNIIGEIRDKGDDDESEMWNMENWLELLKREEGWCEVIRLLEENNTEAMVKLPGVKREISVENYALVGKSLRNIEDERYNRHVVPESVRVALVKEAHSGKVAGHFGTDKIWRQLSKRYYWPKMRVTIERVVRTCPKCLCTNDHPKLIAPLKPYETSAPLEIVACDLIDVGLSAQGNKYILTIIDLFTKYATAVPIADKRGETVVKAFTERWAIGEGRIPNKLLTDMGKEFNNEHFKQLTKLLKIEHIMTKGYNSRANGAVERFNKTLMHIMNKKSAVPIEWDDQVAFAVYAYNSVAHSTTGESPMYLMTGRDPKGPLEMAGEDAVGINYTDVDEYKHLMTSELLKAHALAKEHAQKEREKYKQLFDQKHNTEKRKYPETGSRVLVEIPSEKLGARCPKLVNKWKGPYRVIACSDNSATVVPAWGKGKESLVIPFDHLRVIPNEMGNDPIETVKSRARQRVEINTMHILDKEKHLTNNFCSDLYACRCPTQCHFGLQEVPNVTTTAPTQLQRMAELVKRIPALKSKEKSAELLLLTQKPIQGLEVTPDAHALKAMSHCPTLALWVQDVRGWKDAYDQCRNELLLKHVGCNLGSIKTIQAVLAPNVNASEFPVVLRHKCVVKNAENAVAEVTEQMLKVNTDLLLLVVPFSPSEDDQTMWRDLVNAVPSNTTIYLVPAYMKSFDHQKMEQFIALFERVKRDKGELYHVSPNDIVEGKQNRKLYSASELVDPQEYWTIVKTLLKERKLEWPKFQVSKKEEKKSANQATVSGSEEKARQEGGSSTPSTSDRHHPYMDVYRGRGRGRSVRGGGFRRETYHPYNHISK